MKTIFFYTLGCKVNQYETQAIREKFLKYGYIETDLKSAEVVVINTCTVTSRSDIKSLKFIRKAIRNSSLNSKIIVTGCLAETDEEKIYNIKGIDLILGNKFKPIIADLVENKLRVEDIKECNIYDLKITQFKSHTRAFLKVQDGCNHSCSYCKVPLARDKAHSRNLEAIIDEAELLIKNGYKELILTGVCLGAYGVDLNPETHIESLLKKLTCLEGEFRIRLSSIEPNYITRKLLNFILENNKICNYLHIPLQSGDNRILQLMKRQYKIEKILDLIDYTKSKNPFFSFSTDIIIGFPTEDDNSIKNTINVLEDMQPVRTHIFKFSKRKGTPAYNLEDNITDLNKRRWYEAMLEISDKSSVNFRSKFIGKNLDVLIEKSKNCKTGGYTDNYIYVKTNLNSKKLNDFIKVRVNKVTKYETLGVPGL